jgi:hypothetical protein
MLVTKMTIHPVGDIALTITAVVSTANTHAPRHTVKHVEFATPVNVMAEDFLWNQ